MVTEQIIVGDSLSLAVSRLDSMPVGRARIGTSRSGESANREGDERGHRPLSHTPQANPADKLVQLPPRLVRPENGDQIRSMFSFPQSGHFVAADRSRRCVNISKTRPQSRH
jgi:hypothetical protein